MPSAIERFRRQSGVEAGLESGFTLVEIMVVLLILAILIAIAVPTFLGVTGGADDRAAQSNLNTALTTAKVAANQNKQTYLGVTALKLHGYEPSILFVDAAAETPAQETSPGPVSDYVSTDGNGIVLTSFSRSQNTCWYAVDNLAAVATGGGGAYGAVRSLPGAPGQAPSEVGTWFSKSSGTCNAGTTPTGAIWSNQL